MAASRSGYIFVRLAGLSGVSAVCCGTYGAHVLRTQEGKEHELQVYETASKYHYAHTVAMMAATLTKRPMLVGSLMATGMTLFCGVAYYYAFTSDATPVPLMPYGGVLLMAGWIAMIL
ncbi:transmembrane protein 256 homolog [Apostichopus japonicus]|uniref:transmembrane protein 256 homolog n=1 Tax=Stichopus japonicus TaxID=307972 RepID=UPI003AB1714A